MQNSPQYRPADDDEIDLIDLIRKIRDFIKLVWKEQRYIWYCLAITIPLGLLIAFGSQEEYTASTKILPYRSTGSAAGGLSGLAGLAGIRLPSGATEQLITVDLYPELANTLDFRVELAETPIRFGFAGKNMTVIEYFQTYQEPTLLSIITEYTIGLPGKFLSILRPKSEPMVFADTGEPITIKQYDIEYLKIIEQLGERLQVRTNQTQRVVTSLTIESTMPDPVAAADLVQKASEKLMQAVISYEIQKVNEQIRFLEEQYIRSKTRFEASQQALAEFTDRNRGTLSATAQIEAQRLQSEYNLAFEIYRNFSTELEQARIKQNQDTPIFTILESVTIPSQRSSPRRAVILIGFTFLGGVLGMARVAWRQFSKTISEAR